MIIVKTFLPIIVVVILLTNTIEQSLYHRAVEMFMLGSRKFFQGGGGGPTFLKPFIKTFFLDEGREDPNAIKSGPSSTGSETPFKWRFAAGRNGVSLCPLSGSALEVTPKLVAV